MEFLVGVLAIVGLVGLVVELFRGGNSEELYRYMDDEHPDDYIPRPIEKQLMIR